MKNEQYQPPEPWFPTRFLWWCAGADAQLLQKCPRYDHVKYEGLGGIVLATGILAFLSGSYAFYTIFCPKVDTALSEASLTIHDPTVITSVLAGSVWALIIFNLERFIVSSSGKGDGTDKITWDEFKGALPRILMGIIISFTLAKPLEIRIMQDEINAQLEIEQAEYVKELSEKAKQQIQEQKDELSERIEAVQARIDTINTNEDNKQSLIDRQRQAIEDEIEGKVGSGKPGVGPATKQKRANLEAQKVELSRMLEKNKNIRAELKEELASLKEERGVLEEDLSQQIQSYKVSSLQMGGLVRRISLAHEIAPTISIAITLLLLMIELGPIFFKMMIARSTYDYLKENEEQKIRAKAGIQLMSDMVAKNPTDPKSEYEEIVKARYHEVHEIMEEYQIRLESERRIIQAAYKNYEESILKNPPTSVADTFSAQKRRTHFSNLPPEFQPKATSPEQSDPLLDEQENTGLADVNAMDQEGFIDMDDSNS